MVRLVAMCVAVFALPTFAQAPVEDAPALAPTPSPEATPATDPALDGRISAAEEKLTEVQNDVGILKKIKFSGYIQARYQDAENSGEGFDAKGNSLVKDGFSVRRGRLKTAYMGLLGGAVLQIDAVPKGVTLKDAEVFLIEPWTGKKLTLVVGQTKWPFGYEVIQSSSDRELPERSRVVRAFAPGERDRGAKLLASVGAFRFMGGVFDGNGTENKTPPAAGVLSTDTDHRKDVVGRVGFDLMWLSGGVSGWYGQALDPATNDFAPRRRIGADVQAYLDVLPIGATALKAEFIRGRTYTRDGVELYGALGAGWYALLVQNLGLSNALAVRYDEFDGALGSANTATGTKPDPTNRIGTLGVALIHHWDESVKITLAYDLPMTGTPSGVDDPKDSVATLQFQGRF